MDRWTATEEALIELLRGLASVADLLKDNVKDRVRQQLPASYQSCSSEGDFDVAEQEAKYLMSEETPQMQSSVARFPKQPLHLSRRPTGLLCYVTNSLLCYRSRWSRFDMCVWGEQGGKKKKNLLSDFFVLVF